MQSLRNEEDIRRRCTRSLTHHHPVTPRGTLEQIVAAMPADVDADVYGKGNDIAAFEAQIAELLGKEAAVFMPSGTMAQQIALRVWADRSPSRNVAMHPRNHLDLPERHAYQRLHGLTTILAGGLDSQITIEDLQAVREPLAALLLELPQRELGGQLPTWDDLQAMTDWAHSRGAMVHMDGARLWECGPFYARPYAEIAHSFDSVYVSLYKILGGIAGSVLAGSHDFVDEARAWQKRHGGTLIHAYPMIWSAKLGLARHLPRIPEYCRRARELADVFHAIPGVEVTPSPPQTNMMHAYIKGEGQSMVDAALNIAEDEGVWLFSRLWPTPIAGWRRWEVSIGEAALDISDSDVDRWLRRIVEAGR